MNKMFVPFSGIIVCLGSANERQRYIARSSHHWLSPYPKFQWDFGSKYNKFHASKLVWYVVCLMAVICPVSNVFNSFQFISGAFHHPIKQDGRVSAHGVFVKPVPSSWSLHKTCPWPLQERSCQIWPAAHSCRYHRIGEYYEDWRLVEAGNVLTPRSRSKKSHFFTDDFSKSILLNIQYVHAVAVVSSVPLFLTWLNLNPSMDM